MKSYKGILRIKCRALACAQQLTNCVPECMDCPDSINQVLDLDGMVIHEVWVPNFRSDKIPPSPPLEKGGAEGSPVGEGEEEEKKED